MTTFFAGQKLRASALEAWLPSWALKTSDETINNSASLQNDDALVVSVLANATYSLEMLLFQNTNAAANFKLDLVLPAGATWRRGIFDCNNTQLGQMTTSAISGITGTGASAYVHVISSINIASTAGTVQLRWAQNTAHASNATVTADSWLKLIRMA